MKYPAIFCLFAISATSCMATRPPTPNGLCTVVRTPVDISTNTRCTDSMVTCTSLNGWRYLASDTTAQCGPIP